MNVRGLTLTPADAVNEDEFFGVLRRPGIGMPSTVFELNSLRGSFFVFDVFEGEIEALNGYLPGEYKLRMVVEVFGKSGGDFKFTSWKSKK